MNVITWSILIAFTLSYLLIPIFNRFFEKIGIVGRDIHKKDNPKVVDMGGPGVIAGFTIGVFLFIGVNIFLYRGVNALSHILASMITILLTTLIGIFEVMTCLIEDREGEGLFKIMKRRGIPRWLYFLLPLPAAIPLVAAKVGITTIAFPFFPEEIINLGNWYSLLLIPLALLCCSNATNFLAGFNGLEAGMGFILHYFLGIYAITHGNQNAGLLSLTFAASLLAFLKYNWYPAKVFPGDLSYTIGAVAVASAVIGDMEMYAAFCFLPWIIESILKLISGFKAESYGVLQENGTLKHEGKIRSLTHLVMLGNFTEEEVTGIFILSELIVCTIFYFAIG